MRCARRAEPLKAARRASGHEVSCCTLMRWIDYYQKYGEVPAGTRRSRNKRHTINGIRAANAKKFTAFDEQKLREIMFEQPQSFLDELQNEMLKQTGKVWSTATIWRKPHKIGLSLKFCVHQAKQQDKNEVDACFARLLDRMKHPRQLIFVDETARGANASRRRRAWSPRGVTPKIVAPMVREFDKRCALIAACNWEGFVRPACQIVERETGADDANPDRGTVDTARFEDCVEHVLCPLLGNTANAEPNSTVAMDNASIHSSEKIRKLTESTGAMLVFTAPHGPECNPIESMLGEHKKALNRESCHNRLDWMATHQKALGSVAPDQAKQFFKNSEVPMMVKWFEERNNDPEDEKDYLPFPFNDVCEVLMDGVYQ